MFDDAAVLALLEGTGLFRGLPAPDLAVIMRQLRRVQLTAGQLIFSRGDADRDMYLVLDGRVRLSILSDDGRELSLVHATQGDLFGEIAALDGGSRSAEATAIGPVTAAILPQKALNAIVASNPRVAAAVICFLCARLRATNDKLEAIALHPVEVRVARFLIAVLRSNGRLDAPTAEIDLAMSQGELAMLVGASRPKVNLALTLLEDAGVVTRRGMCLTCDIAKLEEFAAVGE